MESKQDEVAAQSENSFRSIMKGTSVFGGVQIFNILISTVRLKLVAVILGPAGIGIAGLFNSAFLTVQQLAAFGLNMAIVREVGESKGDERRLSDVVRALLPLTIALALTGGVLCFCLSPFLSEFTFGDLRFRSSFKLMSVAVFFAVAGSVLMSVLQGLHEIKRLSKASVVGSSVGLIVGVPLYWLLGINGIVPALVVLSVSTFCWYAYSLGKSISIDFPGWKKDVHYSIMKRIFMMGLILMSNDFFKSIVNYLINVFVERTGTTEDVGFFQSCSTMTLQYSAIVFTAMAMDYLPRLAAVAKSNVRMCEVVNRQMEVVGLLITPIAASVIFLAPWVIEILQTSRFVVAAPLLRLLALSVVFKALMYPLGYIIFAKDNKRLFFWMESVGANVLTLLLTCWGYSLFGLQGLGVAAIADCMICLVVYVIVNRRLYGYHLSSRSALTMVFSIAMAAVMLLVTMLLKGWAMMAISLVLIIFTGYISLSRLMRLWRK